MSIFFLITQNKEFSSNIIKFHIFQLEKKTYKKNQYKAQLVQNEPMRTEIDQLDQIESNRNCLIFRENKLFSTNFIRKPFASLEVWHSLRLLYQTSR